MKWSHTKAKCGKCDKKFRGLNAQEKVQKHQNAKHSGKGRILFYITIEEEWEK